MASGAAAVGVSAWAPLRVRAFRALWIAQLASMIGTWMQTVGAQWLLVGEPNAAMLVALVQTAAMVPTLMLALPAGALGDIVDRRRLLIGLQGFQLVVGAVLVALTLVGRLAPAPLLVLTFLLGCGQALTVPGYQALVQDLVPRSQLRSAAALNGVAMNLARAVGPAVAGLLIARVGVAAVFALNAATFAAFAVVLAAMPRGASTEKVLPERFVGALIAGARYVRHAPPGRRMMLRIVVFGAPGAALWGLVPLVARPLPCLEAAGLGVLRAARGGGAVGGAAAGGQPTPWPGRDRLWAAACRARGRRGGRGGGAAARDRACVPERADPRGGPGIRRRHDRFRAGAPRCGRAGCAAAGG